MIVAGLRIVLAVLMARFIDNVALFPLVFAALVLQKTYLVSKQALVPSVVRTEAELVEANAKLGVISGLTGCGGRHPGRHHPADAAQGLGDADLLRGAVRRGARRTPPGCRPTSSRRDRPSRPSGCSSTRVACGWRRRRCSCCGPDRGSCSSCSPSGCGPSPAARSGSPSPSACRPSARCSATSSRPPSGAACGRSRCSSSPSACRPWPGSAAAIAGGPAAGVVLAAVLNFAGAIARLAFESIVQRDAPEANRGRAFAKFETHFQFAWAVGRRRARADHHPRPRRLPDRRA